MAPSSFNISKNNFPYSFKFSNFKKKLKQGVDSLFKNFIKGYLVILQTLDVDYVIKNSILGIDLTIFSKATIKYCVEFYLLYILKC